MDEGADAARWDAGENAGEQREAEERSEEIRHRWGSVQRGRDQRAANDREPDKED